MRRVTNRYSVCDRDAPRNAHPVRNERKEGLVMTESTRSTPDNTSAAPYQTPDEAEESFLALVRALRAIRSAGAARNRPARGHAGRNQPAPPAA